MQNELKINAESKKVFYVKYHVGKYGKEETTQYLSTEETNTTDFILNEVTNHIRKTTGQLIDTCYIYLMTTGIV